MARDRQRAKQRRRRQDGAQPPRSPREPRIDELAEDPALEGTTPGSHPDSGLEDVVDPHPGQGATPAPDPLKHSSAWTDEAKLAEAGADIPDEDGELPARHDGDGAVNGGPVSAAPADEPDFYADDDAEAFDGDRAPDAVEGDAVPTGRRGRPAAVAATPARRSDGDGDGADGRDAERADRPRRGRFVTFLGHSADELKRVQWPDRKHTFQGTAVTLGFVVLAGGYLGLMDAIWKPIVEAIL
jgi:preprotein translocase SecE subunit